MSDKDLNEKNIEKSCQDEMTRRLLNQVVNRAMFLPEGQHGMLQKSLHLRPHTWVFLRQKHNLKTPVICLGIVFNTWDRAKFNMLRFTGNHRDGTPVATSGRITVLDNGEIGIVIDARWAWTTLLKKFKGLSAGNL